MATPLRSFLAIAVAITTIGGCDPAVAPKQSSTAALVAPIRCSGGPCYRPGQGTAWQWQISRDPGTSDSAVDYVRTGLHVALYDIDGFENGNGGVRDAVARIHAEGARAICYLDVGSYEPWRPDMQTLRHDHPEVVGSVLPDWPDQRWLDFRAQSVVYPIMRSRLDMCQRKHFDGVQFDDLVAYQEHDGGGFTPKLTPRETVTYAAWLANEAHRRGLSAAFENAIEIAAQLQPYYDWALFEECTRYRECDAPGLTGFLRAGKLTGDVEYTDWEELPPLHTWCKRLSARTSGMLKNRPLDAARTPCP